MSTRPCPHCGASIPERARFCGQCGQTIEAAAPEAGPAGAPAKPGQNLAKTLLEASPFGADPERTAAPDPTKTIADPDAAARARDAALEAASAAAAPQGSLGKTMLLGGAAPAPEPSPAPAPSPALAPDAPSPAPAAAEPEISPLSSSVATPGASFADAAGKRTMLGMPATGLPAPAPAAPAPAAPAPAPAAAPAPHVQRTMLGVAIPGIAPLRASGGAPDAPSPEAAPPRAAPAPAAPAVGSAQRTMMGVIAPPGGIPNANAAAKPYVPPIVAAPPPLVDEPLPQAPKLPPKRGVPAIAVVGIVFAVVAVAGGVGAYFLLRGGDPLTARPQLDETGREFLQIGCPSCPDGTVIALGASSAKVTGGAARLPLPAPLSIGENNLALAIDRPAAGRDETVEVHVPVAYRVRADLSTLSAKPPAITVRIEAEPGSDARVDGKPVALDELGRGAYAIDISSETEGPSDALKTVERKIPFAITPKGKALEKGELTARAGVVPLHIDAPGTLLVTDKTVAPVSGQTNAKATIAIDGQPATVDASGRFGGVGVPLPSTGDKEVTIVASSPPLAPRTVHATIRRVASLEEAAKALDGAPHVTYQAFAAEPLAASVGKDAVVEGEVLDARVAGGHTVLLVDEKKACTRPACLVRVDHGDTLSVSRGDTVRAYGKVAGPVTADGKTVPSVNASLVLVRGKK